MLLLLIGSRVPGEEPAWSRQKKDSRVSSRAVQIPHLRSLYAPYIFSAPRGHVFLCAVFIECR